MAYELTHEYQEDYLKLLRDYKTSGVKLVSYNSNNLNIKSNKYYNAISFRIYFCELVYNAVMLFPDITEYTIICKGTYTTSLKIGYFDELDDNGEPTVAKISSYIGDYSLNKQDFFQIFRANRDPDIDTDTVNSFVIMMIMDGNAPIIKTSYKSKPATKKEH